MTAIVSFLRPDGAYLAADGLNVDLNGKVVGSSSKLYLAPHLPAAFALTGYAWLANSLIETAYRPFATFDALIAGIEQMLPAAHEAVIKSYRDSPVQPDEPYFNDFHLFIVGWSAERRRPAAYAIASSDEYGFTPYRLRPLNDLSCMPLSNEGHHALGMDTPDGLRALLSLDPAVLATRVMQEQRMLGWQRIEGEPEYLGVGMFVELARVTPKEITTRIVHRWSDPIGQRIPWPPADAAA